MKKFLMALLLVGAIYSALYVWQNPTRATNAIAGMTGHIAQAADSRVEGKPSLSAAFIDKVLLAANSKAAGTGQALYDLSLKYGIDDAYALAFFEHESLFGTSGVARSTLSLGNIRCSSGYQCIEGYRAYGSWIAGYLDWYRLIRDLYISQWHLTTVQQIVPKYAPSSDGNNVAGYIAAVEKDVVTWRVGSQA